MDEKISLEAIALYADSYADKVHRGFFSENTKISGRQILSLCSVKQINLFIIKELFRTWKEETNKAKSPYFDFDNPEVKEALENFTNVLSKNISISATHFAPLLKKAVSQTLLVIFNPYDFFSILVAGKNNKLETASFREEIKYLKINKAPLERMLQKLEEKHLLEVSGNEAFGILDTILEEVQFTPEDVEGYVEAFSSVVPLDPNRFFVSKHPEYKSAPVQSFPSPKENVKVNSPKASPATAPVPSRATVNDKAVNTRPTVGQNFHKISRIKDSLTINQKFMFTKVLFHGDFELFTKAIERLDQLDNISAALRYIEEDYASTWDRDSEEFHEFMELVEKRFA